MIPGPPAHPEDRHRVERLQRERAVIAAYRGQDGVLQRSVPGPAPLADVDDERHAPRDFQHLGQDGDALARTAQAKPSQVGQVQVGDGAGLAGQPFQAGVVDDRELAVPGELDVEFERHPEGDRLPEGGQRVLGGLRGVP